jgi:hypothetical protein
MTITTRQEAVMGQTIPQQHPAVVLRSHYVQLRMLLAVALVAIAALAATVVVLAVEDDGIATAGKTPGVQITKVGVPGTGPATQLSQETAVRRAAVQGKATPVQRETAPSAEAPVWPTGPRYDGGPDEGTRGIGH